MIRPQSMARGALLCALAIGAACHHRGARGAAPPPAPDSLSGTVLVTGSSPEERLVLRSGALAVYLTTSVADAAALKRLSGVQLLVRGRSDATVFTVTDFTVTHVDSAPALDGVLRTDGSRLEIETRTGRVALGNPSAALRALVGARVWITGPPQTGPLVYGVISLP